MSGTTVLLIAIPVLVVLAAIAVFATARRSDASSATGVLSRETRKRDRSRAPLAEAEPARTVTGREVELAARPAPAVSAPRVPAPYVPPDPETVDVTRRQFLNRGMVGFMAFGLSGFGAACLAFLWPKLSGGFGSRITLGSASDVISQIRANDGFLYVPEGRAWVTEYPVDAIAKAEAVYPEPVLEGMRAGVVALYQKCPHLGCRVPECKTSQWFECPCHGSQYNRVGEKKGGPAPRGMDRFAVSASGGTIVIDTGAVFDGPAIGTNTTGQEAEGPHCISAGGGH